MTNYKDPERAREWDRNYRRTPEGFFRRTAMNWFGSSKNWGQLKRLWERQNKLSAYFRIQLIPGVGGNMSLDHKKPRSHGGKTHINNLQWVTKQENHLKHDMTDKQFRQYLKTVLIPALRGLEL